MAGLATAATRVVLAGDPRQLGPIVHSRTAAAAGLRLSWMERLLSHLATSVAMFVLCEGVYAAHYYARPAHQQRRGTMTAASSPS